MVVKKNKILILVGTLLYPLYALPWIIKYMVKNETFGYVLFSLTMGFYAYLLIPYFQEYDLTRHYEDIVELAKISFDQIEINYRAFFDIYKWLIPHSGLPKEFLPFSIIFMIYLFAFLTLQKIIMVSNVKFQDKYIVWYKKPLMTHSIGFINGKDLKIPIFDYSEPIEKWIEDFMAFYNDSISGIDICEDTYNKLYDNKQDLNQLELFAKSIVK